MLCQSCFPGIHLNPAERSGQGSRRSPIRSANAVQSMTPPVSWEVQDGVLNVFDYYFITLRFITTCYRTHSNLLKAHRLPTTTVRKLGRKGCSAEYRQPYFLITRMAWEAFSAKPAQLASHYHCVLHAHSVALCRIRVGVGGISNFQSLCQPRPRKIFHMKSSTGHESDTNPSNMAGHSWYEWLGMMQRGRTEPRSIKKVTSNKM